MAERSPYQQKIIKRYYEHRDQILLNRLQELVGELYLADSDRKADNLWKRVDKALVGLKTPDSIRTHLLQARNPEALARQVRDWLEEAKRGPGK